MILLFYSIFTGGIYAPVCALGYGLPGGTLSGGAPGAALWADTLKNNVVSGKLETMGIPDRFLKIRYIVQVYIKNTATGDAFHMIMVVAEVVEMIRITGNLPFPDLSHLA